MGCYSSPLLRLARIQRRLPPLDKLAFASRTNNYRPSLGEHAITELVCVCIRPVPAQKFQPKFIPNTEFITNNSTLSHRNHNTSLIQIKHYHVINFHGFISNTNIKPNSSTMESNLQSLTLYPHTIMQPRTLEKSHSYLKFAVVLDLPLRLFALNLSSAIFLLFCYFSFFPLSLLLITKTLTPF